MLTSFVSTQDERIRAAMSKRRNWNGLREEKMIDVKTRPHAYKKYGIPEDVFA